MQTSTRRFARASAAAFLLVTVYTVAFKAPSGELGDDWTHTILHVVGGVIAVFDRAAHRKAEAARRSRHHQHLTMPVFAGGREHP
jgi:hypothetical protein